MKVLAINGSPRGSNGNTHLMVAEILAGMEDAGATTENIFLSTKKVHHCMGCFTCWTKTPGKCAIKDDMEELLQKQADADIIIYASPLYVDNITGLMKNYMDRSIPLALPYFDKDANGECKHQMRGNRMPPKIVLVSNCGFPEREHFQVISHLFKRVARNMSTEVIAEIYRDGGEILKNENILLKPLIYMYKRALKRAGRELIERQKISDDTMKRLEKPIISAKRYIEHANKHWDKVLAKTKE